MVKKNVCVFISGNGSNLKNLILKSREYNFPINIKLVVCNNKKANGIKYAKMFSIPILIINTRKNYEIYTINRLKAKKISLICLAGYMKVLSTKFLKNFKKPVINVHPSLLPKFKGLNTFERILNNKEKKTGCTIHFVNKNLDSGKIICQKSFMISKNDSIQTLKMKTQKLEYIAYPEAIFKINKYI